MKVIHIGDLHLGKSFHKLNIIDDQRHALDQIVELMHSQKANLIIAGDVFDSANPSLEAQELFLYFANRVSDVCKQHHLHCWITVGNHDSTRRLMLFSSFLRPEIDIIEDVMTTVVDGVKLCFLSFVKPVTAEMRFNRTFDNYSDAFNAYLKDVTAKEHTTLITHQSFENCTTGKSEALTFFDDAILLSDVKDYALVLAAHIHKKQKVGDNVYYCGSLLPYAFGDSYSYDVRVWDIQPDGTYTYEDYPINILHDLQVVKGNLQHCLAQEDTGAFVKVELIDETLTPEFAITELKAHFKNLVTVTAGVKDTWEADLNKPMEQFASFTEAIDSFCQQIEIPEFTDSQKAIIVEVADEVKTVVH